MILMKLIRTLLIFFLRVGSVFFVSFSSYGQTTSELGFGLGATNYKGEIAPNYQFLNNRPAVIVFYKKDLSKAIVARGSFLAGIMRAADERIDLPLHQTRAAHMITNLVELAAGIDYNFLNYYDQKQRIRWTPYFFAGAAVANYNNKVTLQNNAIKPFENGFVFSVPAGVGVKYALSYNWNLGLEVGARKAILQQGDKVDFLNNKNTSMDLPFNNPYDKDWYFFNGITLSYTFYKLVCPDVYKNNPRLLR